MADTQELLERVNRRKIFNAAGQVAQDIDANTHLTASVHDARGRRIRTNRRLSEYPTKNPDPEGDIACIVGVIESSVDYRRRGSNSHVHYGHRILSPARLPFRHFGTFLLVFDS